MRDARPWWPGAYTHPSDPVSANYYPVTAAMTASDTQSGATLSILPVQVSHGGSSLADGEFEIMVNRAVVDDKGATKTGNRFVEVQDVLTLHGSRGKSLSTMRPIMSQLANPVVILAAAPDSANQQQQHQRLPNEHQQQQSEFADPEKVQAGSQPFSPLAQPLPANIEILTLQTLRPGMNVTDSRLVLSDVDDYVGDPTSSVVLLRVRHIYAVGEDPTLAKVYLNVCVCFHCVFSVFCVCVCVCSVGLDLIS